MGVRNRNVRDMRNIGKNIWDIKPCIPSRKPRLGGVGHSSGQRVSFTHTPAPSPGQRVEQGSAERRQIAPVHGPVRHHLRQQWGVDRLGHRGV